jgi:hypothetical protein
VAPVSRTREGADFSPATNVTAAASKARIRELHAKVGERMVEQRL